MLALLGQRLIDAISGHLLSEVSPEALDPIEVRTVGREEDHLNTVLEVLEIRLGGLGFMGGGIVRCHEKKMVGPHLHHMLQVTAEVCCGLARIDFIEGLSQKRSDAPIQIGHFILAWSSHYRLAPQSTKSSAGQIRTEMQIRFVLHQENGRLWSLDHNPWESPAICLTQLPGKGFFSKASIRWRLT